jgi:hypothetical protein
MKQLTIEPLVLPGARIGDENPLLHFREAQVNRQVGTDGLPERLS